MEAAHRKVMNQCNNMAKYDQWSYMTMFDFLDVVFTTLRGGIQMDRLLFEEGCEKWLILRENCPLTIYLQMVVQDPVCILGIMARVTKQIDPKCLWLADTQFSYAGAQRAAV